MLERELYFTTSMISEAKMLDAMSTDPTIPAGLRPVYGLSSMVHLMLTFGVILPVEATVDLLNKGLEALKD